VRADLLKLVFEPPAVVERIVDQIKNRSAFGAARVILGNASLESVLTE